MAKKIRIENRGEPIQQAEQILVRHILVRKNNKTGFVEVILESRSLAIIINEEAAGELLKQLYAIMRNKF